MHGHHHGHHRPDRWGSSSFSARLAGIGVPKLRPGRSRGTKSTCPEPRTVRHARRSPATPVRTFRDSPTRCSRATSASSFSQMILLIRGVAVQGRRATPSPPAHHHFEYLELPWESVSRMVLDACASELMAILAVEGASTARHSAIARFSRASQASRRVHRPGDYRAVGATRRRSLRPRQATAPAAGQAHGCSARRFPGAGPPPGPTLRVRNSRWTATSRMCYRERMRLELPLAPAHFPPLRFLGGPPDALRTSRMLTRAMKG